MAEEEQEDENKRIRPRERARGQKHIRLRSLLLVKGLVLCFYLGWSGSILKIRTNMIKVGSMSWLL